MPIDRAATLRHAEKLVRQGKLELAAAEYLRVVEDNPRDWTTPNALGDLYVRLGQTDKAVEQFARIADHLTAEGFLPKAGALYKKILKLKPDHERTLLQMAEIAASQGLIADARAYLSTVLERRQSRRDKKGVAELRVRLGSLDPADFDGRFAAARAHVELGEVASAVRDLQAIAADLTKKGKEADAFKVLQEAAGLDPSDRELRGRLARAAVARGDLGVAAQFLTSEIAGEDPELLFLLAGIRLRSQVPDEGLAIVARMLERHPERWEQVARLGWSVAGERPDAGFAVMRLIVDEMMARGEAASAASALQEFARRAPNYIPALLRLIEVSIDGGLESIMHSAQAQLTDAYLTAGMAAEAHFLAEDLVAREPWEPANMERLRRALELSGESDPAGLIAERLSGRSPFMTTDLAIEDAYFPAFEPPVPVSEAGGPAASSVEATLEAPPAQTPVERPHVEEEAPAPEVSAPAAAASARAATAHAEAETVEVDLSIVLDAGEGTPPQPTEAALAGDADLESVFARLRGEAARRLGTEAEAPRRSAAGAETGHPSGTEAEVSRRSAVEAAEVQYKRALVLREAGDLDGAIAALQDASRVPTLRFAAASLLGRIFRDRGMMARAVEWFERAAEAPAGSPEEFHALLYDFAEVLEQAGEIARALAVSLELQAEAGDYRDVETRVDRLSKVQTRG